MTVWTPATAKEMRAPGRRRAATAWPAARRGGRALTSLMRSPLTRNGFALTASAGLTSVLGLAFWVLAARLYSPEQLGVSAALIATLAVLGAMAQLNLGSVLNRFLPDAGVDARRLILFVYCAAVPAALVIAAGFLLAVGRLVAPLAFLAENPWMAAWFALAVVAWTLFALQDNVLAGLRQSVWVPVENAAYAVAKIALLVLLAYGAVVDFGPFAAWTLPLLVIIAIVNLLIFRRLLPTHNRRAAAAARLDPRRIARFFGWDYVGMLAMMAASGVAPILVLKVAGAAANANYYIAETIAYSLYLIGRSMGIALLAEGAANRDRLHALAADALVQTAIPLAAGAVLILAGAPLIMALFGPAYAAEGTTILRVLALSTIPWVLITIRLSVARAEGRTAMVAAVQVTTLVLVLGIGTALLGSMGALGMAIAWLVAHTTVAIGIATVALVNNGPARAIAWLIDLAAAAARLAATIGLRRPPMTAAADPARIVRAILRAAGETDAEMSRPLRSLPSQSDCLTVYLGEANTAGTTGARRRQQGSRVLYKKASSPQGIASLERTLSRVASLRSDPRVLASGFRLPEILAVHRAADAIRLIESRIPGEDGRATLQRPVDRHAALAAAAHAIAGLHERTAAAVLIGEAWLAEWIDRPAGLLRRLPRTLMATDRRLAAIAAFRSEQHAFWTGQSIALGWGHGDFAPGNIVFARTAGRGGAAATIAVSGIVDWDRARPDTPGGFDACYLAVTIRALARGEQIGQAVRALLHAPRWEAGEEAWLGVSGRPGAAPAGWPFHPAAVRAMVGLAWLHHVAANIEKSRRYTASRFWTAANVDWVLREYV